MIFPKVPLEHWTKKFDLEVLNYPCPKCQKTYKTSIPVLITGYAGLMIHDCGKNFFDLVLTPNKTNTKDLWSNLIGERN